MKLGRRDTAAFAARVPLGAHSIVDCFDALTSDQLSRRMTDAAALGILRERSEQKIDPRVVGTFIRVYREIPMGTADAPAHREVMQRITQIRGDAVTPLDGASEPSSATTSLLAFVSLARIASGEGGVADVLALGSRLLGDMVPGATGAWYLPDPARDALVVADTFGPAAAALRGISVGMGERLTGWVAVNRQPLVNSDASLDIGSRAELVMPSLCTCLSIPLIAGDAVVGVLTLYASTTDAFDEDRGRLIQMIAPHLASAIQAATRSSSAILDAQPTADKATGASLRLVATR